MNILSKLKSLFKKKNNPPFEDYLDRANERLTLLAKNEISGQLISFSEASYTCAEGARICVGQHAPEDKQDRLDYIAKVIQNNIQTLNRLSNPPLNIDIIETGCGNRYIYL